MRQNDKLYGNWTVEYHRESRLTGAVVALFAIAFGALLLTGACSHTIPNIIAIVADAIR